MGKLAVGSVRAARESMAEVLRRRDAEIRRQVLAGESKAAVARRHLLSRERVRQIVAQAQGRRLR